MNQKPLVQPVDPPAPRNRAARHPDAFDFGGQRRFLEQAFFVFDKVDDQMDMGLLGKRLARAIRSSLRWSRALP